MNAVTVSVHQPNFMPWLKLVDKIIASDIFVAYDTAQYTKTEYHARQKVMTQSGPGWLSVPIRHVRGTYQVIKDVRIDNSQPFRRRHLRTLKLAYASTPYFDEVFSIIEGVYARGHEYLADLSLDLIASMCTYLGGRVQIVRASELPHSGDRTERLVRLVQHAGGTEHLTSTFGGDHQEVDWFRFAEAGLDVVAQQFEHPVYEQIRPGFVPHLAAVDMMFSCGRQTGEILARRRRLVPVDLARADVGLG